MIQAILGIIARVFSVLLTRPVVDKPADPCEDHSVHIINTMSEDPKKIQELKKNIDSLEKKVNKISAKKKVK